MRKAFPYILLALLAIAVLFIKRCRNASQSRKSEADKIDRNNGLDRRLGFIEYTEHAKCRMECGHISTNAIENCLQNWTIDTAASEFNAKPCPIFALEGYTADKQHLRIIFAQCDFKTKVITCINIDAVYNCRCPGVGTKYEH